MTTITTITLELGSADRVAVADGFDVHITLGDPAVRISLDDDLLSRLRAGTRGKVLRLGLHRRVEREGATLTAHVSMPSITALTSSGPSTVRLDGIEARQLEIALSGSSQLTGSLVVNEGVLTLSGTANADLTGSWRKLGSSVSGASHLRAAGLQVESLTLDATGTSTADVTITRSAAVRASGASQVRYGGEPRIDVSTTSGASRIERRGDGS